LASTKGALGFITDIPIEQYAQTLKPMLLGSFEEEQRSMLHAQVWRDNDCVFDALAMNDVVVNRGATSGMVELRIEVDGRFVATQRADGLIRGHTDGLYGLLFVGRWAPHAPVLWEAGSLHPSRRTRCLTVLLFCPTPPKSAFASCSGRDASANFDMQSLASLMIGDQITVEQSSHKVRFLHP
jgi:NAD+ kinase